MTRAHRCAFAVVAAGLAFSSLAQAPSLTLAEATADGVKFSNLTTAHPRLALTLVNTTVSPITNVRVWGTGLTAADAQGNMLPGNALLFDSVETFGRKAIDLRMHLPGLGEQTTMVWLSGDGVSATGIAVRFTRIGAPKTSLSIGDVPGQRVPIPLLSWSTGTSFDVLLHETAGQAANDIQASARLALKVNDKVSFAAPDPKLELNAGKPLELGPDEWRHVPVSITGINRPGQYEATIVLRTGRAEPVMSTPVTLFVRHSWGLAAAWILFGVAISLILRYLTKVLRPRLALQRRLSGLVDALGNIRAPLNDPVAEEHVDRLERSLEHRYETLSLGGRILGTNDFAIYEAKLPLLRAWIDNHAHLSGASLPRQTATVARKGLDDAANVLHDENATVDTVQLQVSALGNLRNTVDAALRAEIQGQLDTLRKAITSSNEPELQPLLQRIPAIEAQLNSATMPEALLQARNLELDYVKAFAAVLRRQLTNKPHSFPKEQWPELVQDVQASLDAAMASDDASVALTQLRLAITKFVPRTADALASAIDVELKKLPEDDALLALKADVEALRQAAAEHQLDGATRRIDALQTRFAQLLGGSPQTSTAAAVGGDATDVIFGDWLPAVRWRDIAAPDAPELFKRKQRVADVLATLIIATLAVLFGLKVLWSDDWTWGGPQAYLVAFLWGAGLHQLSFNGLSDLLDREKW